MHRRGPPNEMSFSIRTLWVKGKMADFNSSEELDAYLHRHCAELKAGGCSALLFWFGDVRIDRSSYKSFWPASTSRRAASVLCLPH